MVRALAASGAGGRAGGDARGARGGGPGCAVAGAECRPDHGHRAVVRIRARRTPRFRRRLAGRARLELLARAGSLDSMADGGVGPGRCRWRGARGRHRAPPRPCRPGQRLRGVRLRVRRPDGPVADGDLRRGAVSGPLPRDLDPQPAVQLRPRRRQRRVRPGRGTSPGPDAPALPQPLRVRLGAPSPRLSSPPPQFPRGRRQRAGRGSGSGVCSPRAGGPCLRSRRAAGRGPRDRAVGADIIRAGGRRSLAAGAPKPRRRIRRRAGFGLGALDDGLGRPGHGGSRRASGVALARRRQRPRLPARYGE